MKIKNKGKVYPSPNSSSSSSSNDREVLSVLNLLPAAILALASVLSLEDREVLAYMITRSIKTTSSSSSSLTQESKKKASKKAGHSSNGHKPPMFDCDCFDCYTSYWYRWDSSANRELIHQVIEAFEDHLTHGEKSKKNNGRGKRKDKLGRSRDHQAQTPKPIPDAPAHSFLAPPPLPPPTMTTPEEVAAEIPCVVLEVALPENDVISSTTEKNDGFEGNKGEVNENDAVAEELAEVGGDDVAVVLGTMAANEHKGLARKVLPDVLGLFNSRLWSLWSPNA